ncbi:hypothetical protein [Psychrobacter ciconiae]|uniref:hypothetical protein n=1 Tax=Psychrobacter ciconiae TaxID=1553449 RepID=UPI001D127081|nr:hypothetical protein [Psychrobacter ciconiae]
MDWLKSILQSLPLDKISDILGEIVIWWSQMVKGVPPDDLPMYSYVGGSIIVLALWILVARIMPKPLGGMTWMLLFAVLLTPGSALGDPSMIAPASISVVYSIMMKDTAAAINSAIPILVVLVVGMFVGFIWQLVRGAFETSLATARKRSSEDVKATMQLIVGNYLARQNDQQSKADLIKTPILRTKTAINGLKDKLAKEYSTHIKKDKSDSSSPLVSDESTSLKVDSSTDSTLKKQPNSTPVDTQTTSQKSDKAQTDDEKVNINKK